MIDDSSGAADLLGADGPIASRLTGFAPRLEQQHLATAVENTLARGELLVGEAGTGTGKTFAYLVPALLSGQRLLISTGTRHLQDQLFLTDLPLVRQALASPVRASLLKGRANYLCHERLLRAMHNPEFADERSQQHLQRILAWSATTDSGDIAEVFDVPEESPVWSAVVSSEDFCARHTPEELEGCHVTRARRKAQESDIVVINHHLLCADLALKEGGFADLLPSADALIIDEAHQLPGVAAQFFGKRLSSRQLLDVARDTINEQLIEAPDADALGKLARSLETAVRNFRLAFPIEEQRDAWSSIRDSEAMEREYERLETALEMLEHALQGQSERGKGLDSCARRAAQALQTLKAFDTIGADPDFVQWYETWRTGFALNMTPLSVAGPFKRVFERMPGTAWVFTSATLAVGGDFSHFRSALGLELQDQRVHEVQVDSPFDYASHALLYLPEALPEPNAAHYTESCMMRVMPLLEASRGRAFLLFTSYRAMHQAQRWLDERDHPFNLLMQGQMPKRELLDSFQSLPSAVLLGTSSFWEGVDVRGAALSLVVIDKLPFGSPGDPVMRARIDHLRAIGGNPFHEFQLPQAAITLKQGVGRLIRDVSDTGVLVLCDPRLRSRAYGQLFLDSLPPMPMTVDEDEVLQFFVRHAEPVVEHSA